MPMKLYPDTPKAMQRAHRATRILPTKTLRRREADATAKAPRRGQAARAVEGIGSLDADVVLPPSGSPSELPGSSARPNVIPAE